MAEAVTKIVDGVRVPLTPEEKAQIEAEWAANEAEPKPDLFEIEFNGNKLLEAVVEELAGRLGVNIDTIKTAIKTRWLSK